MTITYIHHSGFLVESTNSYIVCDYWDDTPDNHIHKLLMNTDKQIYFLASHVHHDHFNPEIIFFGQHIRYILSADIRRKNKILRTDDRIHWLHRGESFSDEHISVEAHGSTDVGVSFLIHTDGQSIFHAGDFNNWQRPDAPADTNRQMNNYFHSELSKMKESVAHCDVAMFPVDPRHGDLSSIGVREFCNVIQPKCLIPMHCWDQYELSNYYAMSAESLHTRVITVNQPGQILINNE